MDISNRRMLGKVKEMFHDASTVRFEWTIPDCYELRPGYNCSPTVKYFEANWWLELYKSKSTLHFVSLLRSLPTPGIPESVRLTMRWKRADGGEVDLVPDETFEGDSKECGRYIDVPFKTGEVTVTCTLRKGDSLHAPDVSLERETEVSNGRRDVHVNPGLRGVSRETKTEDAHGRNDDHQLEVLSSLSEHFKNLLLSGDGHDVHIKVKDKQFRAHKHILKARSPVFAAMFSNDMAESAEGSVTIEDCDPDAFGEFLQFVYSGKVDIASVSRALGLYYAGDKYDFPRLRDMCVQFLKISFTTTTVFDVINLAARYDEEELLQEAIVFFANNLEEVLLTVEWQRFLLANPIQANEINLKAVQCRLKTSV